MAEQYSRLFLRWEILRGYVPGLLFAAVCIGLELLFFYSAIDSGFVDESVSIPILSWSFPFSIALALSIGSAIVIVALWVNLFEGTAYVKAGPDRQVRRILYPLRMVKTAASVLVPFTILLFVPYVVEANWFVSWVTSVQALNGATQPFYAWAFGISQIDSSTRFIVSQLLAVFAALLVTGLQLLRTRGAKNFFRTLRRRR